MIAMTEPTGPRGRRLPLRMALDLADAFGPDTLAVLYADAQQLADAAGPAAAGWQTIADVFAEAAELTEAVRSGLGPVDDGAVCHFRLDILGEPSPRPTLAFFKADGIAAAIGTARRLLAEREHATHGKLYQRLDGWIPLTVIHRDQPPAPEQDRQGSR